MASRTFYLNLFGSVYHGDVARIKYLFDMTIESGSRKKAKYFKVTAVVDASLAKRWGFPAGSRRPKLDYEPLEYTLIYLSYQQVERHVLNGTANGVFSLELNALNTPMLFPRFSKESAFSEYVIEMPLMQRA